MAHLLTITITTTSQISAAKIMRFAAEQTDADFVHPVVELSQGARDYSDKVEDREAEVNRLRYLALNLAEGPL